MTAGAAFWVVALTVINVAGVLWLLAVLRRRRSGETPADAATTGHVWDQDLREFNHPLPRWWLWLFLLTVIFSAAYLAIYPGLGNFTGRSGWTSASELASQQRLAEQQAQVLLARFRGRTLESLRDDPEARAFGRNLYLNNCALCHGSDARGAAGFPDLTDADWLWGGTPDRILETLSNGRSGVMIGWRATLGGDSGVEDVVAYTLSLSGRIVPAGDRVRGKTLFEANCIACHGADGGGNLLLGAPNLKDHTWLYGGSVATVRDVIANGRTGVMNEQLARYGPDRIRILAAYVMGLAGAGGG